MVDMATTITVLDACGRAQVPVLLVGDPGTGKSALVRGLAAARGELCETVLGAIREPADVGGLPVVRDEGVVLEPPAWARRLDAAGSGTAFLDELTTATPAMQAALLGVALERRVGDLLLPQGVRMVAGANPPDRAADGWELSPPLANRFCHLPFQPTVEEWLDGMMLGWSAPPASRAVAADPVRVQTVRALVTGYIRVKRDRLHMFPESSAGAGGPWPSRRTWAMVADALPFVREDDTAAGQAIVFGLVGEGVGVEFLTWVREADLPDPVAVVDDPQIVNWADRPDRVWAVLSGVVGWSASQGTVSAWRSAWGPLLAAAEAGAVDVAAAAALPLSRCAPRDARPPVAARKTFGPVLAAAGQAALR